jgi:flagellar biosynthesis/type III secretory pathway M-ring protein FliF/YscJ
MAVESSPSAPRSKVTDWENGDATAVGIVAVVLAAIFIVFVIFQELAERERDRRRAERIRRTTSWTRHSFFCMCDDCKES